MALFSRVKDGLAEAGAEVSLRLSSHAHYVRMDDQVIVADMRSGRYLGLDAVGARVWDLVGEGVSRDGIVEQLFAEYDVSMDVLAQDVDRLLQELSARRLIDCQSPR